jgi:hypothetical protein
VQGHLSLSGVAVPLLERFDDDFLKRVFRFTMGDAIMSYSPTK